MRKPASFYFFKRRSIVSACQEQTDNGSKFAWEFERATAKLGIHRCFSRVRTPKDNPEIEKFNEILEYEWLYNFNLSLDPEEFNSLLTDWLIEYEFNRPHQSLAYHTPVEYIEKEFAKISQQVLPMWSASTRASTTFRNFVVYGRAKLKLMGKDSRGPESGSN